MSVTWNGSACRIIARGTGEFSGLLKIHCDGEDLEVKKSEMEIGDFDYSTPFTLGELIAHYDLGSAHDPRVAKPLVTALMVKGYTIKVKGKQRLWAKWPAYRPFIMPDIP